MLNKKWWVVLMVIVSSSLIFASHIFAKDTQEEEPSLQGLHGVLVSTQILAPDFDRDVLPSSQIQTDVESQLGAAGITVLTKEQWQTTPGNPLLGIAVSACEHEGLYAVCIDVVLAQLVRLDRNLDISMWAETWSTGVVGIAVEESLAPTVCNWMREMIDKFINAYLAANLGQ